jgi:hypothetical protein
MTGDSADLTMDPIVNLRDAHLIELYLHRASANRDDHLHPLPESMAHVAASTQVDVRRGSRGRS